MRPCNKIVTETKENVIFYYKNYKTNEMVNGKYKK